MVEWFRRYVDTIRHTDRNYRQIKVNPRNPTPTSSHIYKGGEGGYKKHIQAKSEAS